MAFLWPWALGLLLLLPLLVALYRWARRFPGGAAVLYPDATRALRGPAEQPNLGQRLPPLLYLLALALALLALARPVLPAPRADPKAAVVLAVDVSLSMGATDVAPNRFEAAREALRAFIRGLPEGLRVGLVAFARDAHLLVPPTVRREQLLEAVDHLQLTFGTAIGEAILESLSALPPLSERASAKDPWSLATIVLLTDGRSLSGVDPVEAALEAARQKVRVHTIGIGRPSKGPVPGLPDEYALAARFDEETLREVARLTGGEYRFVDSAKELEEAYRALELGVEVRLERAEATGWLALLAGVFLLLSLALAEFRRRVV
ncbi:VWFA-related Acidobacterial domain protein [Meiothermus luteus]|jgi:Ca-activated chloride channel family protein|uniref:VWFA-related Acidobacterial domain protein n=1 Tax=Meiothermus luteus TaxID=2026184 RepID=A0A399F274_9DEIN|nr:VWA domain-containing protein [Meiothermus luteus]RIH89369.1 VWFA-related Acidobacterial domain protein [Meiothermus luteus]RMH53922.1 MAG: VWA domain-containing protein [Deinococcota bacterium]